MYTGGLFGGDSCVCARVFVFIYIGGLFCGGCVSVCGYVWVCICIHIYIGGLFGGGSGSGRLIMAATGMAASVLLYCLVHCVLPCITVLSQNTGHRYGSFCTALYHCVLCLVIPATGIAASVLPCITVLPCSPCLPCII